jgi:hypothetical protein
VGHPRDVLTAQHRRGGIGRAAQFRDHLVLADHGGEHATVGRPAVRTLALKTPAARHPTLKSPRARHPGFKTPAGHSAFKTSAAGDPAAGDSAGRRTAVKHPAAVHSRMAGMLPVLSSATAGTGSGSMSRIRSWISRLSSSGGRAASSTRYRSGSSLACARKPSLTR